MTDNDAARLFPFSGLNDVPQLWVIVCDFKIAPGDGLECFRGESTHMREFAPQQLTPPAPGIMTR